MWGKAWVFYRREKNPGIRALGQCAEIGVVIGCRKGQKAGNDNLYANSATASTPL